MLSEQHSDHRSDGRVCRRTSEEKRHSVWRHNLCAGRWPPRYCNQDSACIAWCSIVEPKKYYDSFATGDSPKLRDTNPSVVLIPGLGLFGFGKTKKEARITTELF